MRWRMWRPHLRDMMRILSFLCAHEEKVSAPGLVSGFVVRTSKGFPDRIDGQNTVVPCLRVLMRE